MVTSAGYAASVFMFIADANGIDDKYAAMEEGSKQEKYLEVGK